MAAAKHIVVVGPVFPWRGGIAHFNNQLIAAWQQEGHQVTPVTFSRLYPSVLFPGSSQLEPGASAPQTSEGAWIDSLNPRSWSQAGHAIARLRPDYVVVAYWHPFFAWALTRILRLVQRSAPATHRVLLMHNVLPHDAFPFAKTLVRRLMGATHVVATLSGNEQGRALDLLVQQHPTSNRPSVREAFHPIYDQYGPPLPAEEARITLGLQPKNGGGDPNGGASSPPRKIILFFGLIRPYKGLDLLLESVSRLPTVELIVAGEPYMNIDALKERSGHEDLMGRVHWHTDFIPADNVATYFSAADAVVLPYKKATNSGVGLTAVAFGKPLVVTPVGGLPSLISTKTETTRGPSPDINGAVADIGGAAHDGAVANNGGPTYDGAVTANGAIAAEVTADALAHAIRSALSLDPQRVAAAQGELALQWSWQALGRTLLETDLPANETSR